MPPKLTARTLWWIGVALTVFGVASELFLLTAVVAVAGIGAITAAAWASQIIGSVGLPLGILLIAFSPLLRILEPTSVANPRRVGMPPALSARELGWAGVFLTALGVLLLFSMDATVNGGASGGGYSVNLLLVVVTTLKLVCLPLGLALLTSAAVAQRLQSVPSKQAHRHDAVRSRPQSRQPAG